MRSVDQIGLDGSHPEGGVTASSGSAIGAGTGGSIGAHIRLRPLPAALAVHDPHLIHDAGNHIKSALHVLTHTGRLGQGVSGNGGGTLDGRHQTTAHLLGGQGDLAAVFHLRRTGFQVCVHRLAAVRQRLHLTSHRQLRPQHGQLLIQPVHLGVQLLGAGLIRPGALLSDLSLPRFDLCHSFLIHDIAPFAYSLHFSTILRLSSASAA